METEQQHFIYIFHFLAIAVSYRHRKLNDNPSDHQLSIVPYLACSAVRTYVVHIHTCRIYITNLLINLLYIESPWRLIERGMQLLKH